MAEVFTKRKLKVLSGLFTNLSAGWIGAVLVFPNFSDLSLLVNQLILTLDIIAAIVSLLIAFWLDEKGFL